MIALEVVKLALWSIEMILMSWSSGTLYSCSSISEDVGGRLLRGWGKNDELPITCRKYPNTYPNMANTYPNMAKLGLRSDFS